MIDEQWTRSAAALKGDAEFWSLRIVDDRHMTGRWQYFEDGKLKNEEKFEYTRVR